MSNKYFLLPVDNTPTCNFALSYVSTMFQDDPEATFHLIHCQPLSSESIIPQPLNSDESLLPDKIIGSSETSRAIRLVNTKSEFFQNKGIDSRRITSSVISAGNIVAQSLISEAEKMLTDSLVLARRGVGFIGEMVMGSLSATLFRDLHTIPIWISDGEVRYQDILLAVDGSIHSLRAVDHLAQNMAVWIVG